MLSSKPDDGGRRVIAGGRQHVVPLQDLVQDDPVEEAAEADAQQERRKLRRLHASPHVRVRTRFLLVPWAALPRVRRLARHGPGCSPIRGIVVAGAVTSQRAGVKPRSR